MYQILWDNLPVENIIKFFSNHTLFTDDDLDVISFAPSEYLKNQLLLRYLQRLKLSMWSKICDILHNTKSLRHVGSQLMNGKYNTVFVSYAHTYTAATYVAVYVNT